MAVPCAFRLSAARAGTLGVHFGTNPLGVTTAAKAGRPLGIPSDPRPKMMSRQSG